VKQFLLFILIVFPLLVAAQSISVPAALSQKPSLKDDISAISSFAGDAKTEFDKKIRSTSNLSAAITDRSVVQATLKFPAAVKEQAKRLRILGGG